MSFLFDLEKQFTFYASYHNNPINKFVHICCIWPILASAMVLMAETEVFYTPDTIELLPVTMTFNWSLLPVMIYIPWYMILDWFAGSLAGMAIFGIYLGANYLVKVSPIVFGVSAWQIALPVHIGGWLLQFIGHGVFEKRAPALFDSLDQAIITAPLFVFLECLFPLGYRKTLFHRIEHQVERNLIAFHSQKKIK